MSAIFTEFLNENLHRSYPLTEASGGLDSTGAFSLPSSLISDIFLCAPCLPEVDKSKFYIERVVVRKSFVDIELGYDDALITSPLGVFRNIDTSLPPHQAYDFIPYEYTGGGVLAPLYYMTGQVIVGEFVETVRSLGSWNFDQSTAEKSTKILETRISKGLLNVQYISINDRLYTGNVKLKEGANVSLDVDTRTLEGGDTETVITVSASLNAASTLQLSNDEDVINALTDLYGRPIRTINGMLPDPNRNFNVLGGDCTAIEPEGSHAVVISNPCSRPCCDEDTNIDNILSSIANLNQRYATLKAFYDSTSTAVNSIQNKLLVLGSEV